MQASYYIYRELSAPVFYADYRFLIFLRWVIDISPAFCYNTSQENKQCISFFQSSGELSEWSKVQHSKSRWRKSTAMPDSPYFTRFSAMCLVSNSRSSNTNSNTFVISGELSEWSKVQHSKCCVLTKHPGFESLTLRHLRNHFCLPRQKWFFRAFRAKNRQLNQKQAK